MFDASVCDWLSKGLPANALADVRFKAVDVSDFNCIEIDFVEDLHEANKKL